MVSQIQLGDGTSRVISMQTPQARIAQIDTILRGHAYQFGRESDLHSGMSQVLKSAGIEHQREVVAGPSDRFDILAGRIVIEAKIKGSMSQALLQCKRYAQREDVDAVILVTTRFWGRGPVSHLNSIGGKPFIVSNLKGAAF